MDYPAVSMEYANKFGDLGCHLPPINPRMAKAQEQGAIVYPKVLNDACNSVVPLRGVPLYIIYFWLMCDKGKEEEEER